MPALTGFAIVGRGYVADATRTRPGQHLRLTGAARSEFPASMDRAR